MCLLLQLKCSNQYNENKYLKQNNCTRTDNPMLRITSIMFNSYPCLVHKVKDIL